MTAASCRDICWRRFAELKSADQIEQELKRKNITHLMVREDLLTDFLAHNLTPKQGEVWNRFAESRLTLSFR